MKNVIKSLTFGMVLAATTSIFGQVTPETCTPIYDKYIANRKGPELDKFQTAVATGKEYLEKCKGLEGGDEVYNYVTKDLPKVEARVEGIKFDEEVIKPFNASVPAKNWDVAFNTGKQIIAKNPDFIDVMLVLASIGFDNATANPPVDKFNADAINMAKMALQKMNEGKTSDNYGAFVYTYKTKECADGKTNATGWMNYTIGNIMYYRTNQKKDALPYLYKAVQVGCETKNNAEIYRTIGAWYIDEFRKIEDQKNAKYKELQDTEKANATDPKLPELEKQYNEIVALQKGYMERVMDAYARAYRLANANPKATAEYKNALLNNAKRFYGFRNNNDMSGYDAWYAGVSAKAFPDPTSAVTPIVEATPATSGTPGAMSVTSDSGTTPTTDTRPRTATTGTGATATKTTTTAPATTAATATKTTTKAPATKKPAPKKKGTR